MYGVTYYMTEKKNISNFFQTNISTAHQYELHHVLEHLLRLQSYLTANFRYSDSKQSCRFDGLKRFSDEEWLCLPRFPNFTLKKTLQSLQLSLGFVSDISALHNWHVRFSPMFGGSIWILHVCLFLSEIKCSFRFIFIGRLFISGRPVKRD